MRVWGFAFWNLSHWFWLCFFQCTLFNFLKILKNPCSWNFIYCSHLSVCSIDHTYVLMSYVITKWFNRTSHIYLWQLNFIKAIQVYQRDRRSCPKVFCKKGVLKNFAKFTKKTAFVGYLFYLNGRPALLKSSENLWFLNASLC